MNCSSAVPLKSAHGTPGVNTKRQDRHKQFIRVHRPVNETDDRALTDDEAETQTCRETWNCCALLSTICWCSLKMDGMRRNHWMVCALSLVCSGERAVWSTRKHSRVTESVNLCSSRFISEVFTWSTKAWVEVEVKKNINNDENLSVKWHQDCGPENKLVWTSIWSSTSVPWAPSVCVYETVQSVRFLRSSQVHHTACETDTYLM